ncbi:MAG: DNA gyrase C-terminal beta-propeller domain-containing protein, partial [Phycisphaeraceae bacterium]|nr:DNA gyrase C-terminal beta-propeller domain-containing protein [Phycisphaeraceae bacterium]
ALDARTIGDVKEDPKKPEYAPATHAIAVSSDGYSLRFGLEAFIEPSTRTGRRFARPAKTAEIVAIKMIHGDETALAASTQRRVMVCPVEEVNYLSGPGKGVMLIKLARDDRLIGFTVATDDRDTLTVKTSMGGEQRINTARYEVTGRGGKGREVIKKGSLIEVVHEEASVSAMLGEQ